MKRWVWIGFLLVAVLVAAFFVLRSDHQSQPAIVQPALKNQAKAAVTNIPSANLETTDFKYKKPSGWATLDNATLVQNAADSGIGLSANQSVLFTTQTSSVAPSSETDLESSTLDVLKKLSNFQLVSSTATQINGQAGRKFIYNFGDQSIVERELDVAVHNKKTYFLQFSAPAANFSSSQTDLSAILNSFEFK